jgi:hypothetical protein
MSHAAKATVSTFLSVRRFKGEYWQARKTGNWEGIPDIYETQH